MTAFADFIAPFDAKSFRADYYGKKPLHLRANAQRENILTWQRLNEVLAITPYWNEDTLKLAFKSKPALRENYCDTADLRPGQSAPANPSKVNALMGLGASLVANSIQRVCPEVATVAHMLEREFAARVAANVYCSFQAVQAFQTHYDLHDVFAVQTEGEKVWQVYEARADNPVAPLPPGDETDKYLVASRGRVLFEARMQPGDILYLPRGQYHDALAQSQASLHVTFGVSPPTGLSLFKALEAALGRESLFRAYVPDARNEAELRDHLAKLAERMKAAMTSPAFATDVLNHQRGLHTADAGYALPVSLKPTWYAVTAPSKIARRDAGVVLTHAGGEIALGAAYPALEWALQQRYFSVEDALARHPAVERSEFLSLLQQFTRAGLITQTEMQR